MEKDKIVQTAQAKKDILEIVEKLWSTADRENYKALDDQKCGSPDQSEEIHIYHMTQRQHHMIHILVAHMIHMKTAHMIWWQHRCNHHQMSQPMRLT